MMRFLLRKFVQRNKIKAANERHQAIKAFREAVRKGDIRKQHELEKAAQQATVRALRLGA